MDAKTSPNRLPLVLAGLAGATLLGAAPSAVAETPPARSVTAVQVVYDDLDLSTSAGSRQLVARIRAAADDACRSPMALSPLLPRDRAEHRACTRDAVTHTLNDLSIPATAVSADAKTSQTFAQR